MIEGFKSHLPHHIEYKVKTLLNGRVFTFVCRYYCIKSRNSAEKNRKVAALNRKVAEGKCVKKCVTKIGGEKHGRST